jgi:hypothetical protein
MSKLNKTSMKNFIAYHKVAEWGPYEPEGTTEFCHYSAHPLSKLEMTIGQTVWVISGTRIYGRMIYKLCGVYEPSQIEELAEGGFHVVGKGREFDPQIELNPYFWLADLLKEQRNFRYGLNQIRSPHIVKGFQHASQRILTEFYIPEEIELTERLPEGAKKQIMVNAYERNPVARATCIEYYGYSCYVCGFNFEAQYGEIGKDYIQVHHLIPLSIIAKKYQVNPIEDLRPICPNCHAMVHRKEPPFTLQEITTLVRTKFT